MEFTGERYVPGIEGLEEIYVEHMSRYVVARPMARACRVLDLGCGCGYGAHLLAGSGAERVVGIDISTEAVDFARSHYSAANLDLAVMDAYKLALRPGFDLVTCFEMIEHVEHPDKVLMQVADVMKESGILLVSTPNKQNYRAGGEAGSNPFHYREYCEDEFRRLLESCFKSVIIYGQHWSESMVLKPAMAPDGATEAEAAILPVEQGCRQQEIALGDPVYFLALCSLRPGAETEAFPATVVHSFDARYPKTKESTARLKAEFDRRGQWAKGLEADLHRRDETIRWLQQKLDRLTEDFDERGRWAQSLDRRISKQEQLIKDLEMENERLRRRAGVEASAWHR
jgi:SAM-dependent methyltransferase